MIGAVDEQHVGITQRLRGRQASETAPDNDDLFVRHEREPETGYVSERQVSTFGGTDAARRETWIDDFFFFRHSGNCFEETSASPRTMGEAHAVQDAPSQFEHYREGFHHF